MRFLKLDQTSPFLILSLLEIVYYIHSYGQNKQYHLVILVVLLFDVALHF